MSRKTPPLLTTKQRSYLGTLASQAYRILKGSGAIDEPEKPWRHSEAQEATRSDEAPEGFTISTAPKRCFDDLETRFLMLAGKTKQAFDRAIGPGNDLRTISHEISVAAKTAGVTENYVKGICRRMFNGRETWATASEASKVLVAVKKMQKRQAQEENAQP